MRKISAAARVSEKPHKNSSPKKSSSAPLALPDFPPPGHDLLDLDLLGQELVAAHELALAMAEKAHDHLERAEQPGALARDFHTAHANASALAAARLMTVYRQGLLAIHKVQGTHEQVITVRHVSDTAKMRGAK